jgi:DMSO/TMAO reductase YedYZ molybdopterin-dependent catalytic subunit
MATTTSPAPVRSGPPAPPAPVARWAAALAGALAAAVALAVTAVADGFSPRMPSVVAAVGQNIIQLTPGWLTREGIEAAGTADKPILLVTIVVACVALGARVGTVAARRPAVAPIGFGVAALVGVWSTRAVPGTPLLGALVTALVAVAAGVVTLRLLLAHAPHRTPLAGEGPDAGPVTAADPLERRRFLGLAAGAGAAVAVFAATGRVLGRAVTDAAQRVGITLPAAADPVAAPAAGTSLEVAGLSPLVTPNADFYRIDAALQVPVVDLASWRLGIEGLVDEALSFSFDDLLAMPLVERHITLSCVSNEVGGDLVGTAKWLGVPLPALLERAGIDPSATQVVGRSVDGFTVAFPLELALDGRDALVAVAMNDEPLPFIHGFPARLVVPGLYGYVSATKWLSSIELTTDDVDPYWIVRGWAREGPVKTQSRIDVPRSGDVPAGRTAVAGVAWAPTRGIEAVEVRLDEGRWQEARLADSLGVDTWRQWVYEWDATPGEHTIEVRATDGEGDTQTGRRVPVFPDGATGHDRIFVTVTG